MTRRMSSVGIASRCTSMFGFCSSNLAMISSDTLSRAVVSRVASRNLTTSSRPPPQPAAPKRAAASPAPPSFRKSLRLTAFGICRYPLSFSMSLWHPLDRSARYSTDLCADLDEEYLRSELQRFSRAVLQISHPSSEQDLSAATARRAPAASSP